MLDVRPIDVLLYFIYKEYNHNSVMHKLQEHFAHT